MTETALPQIDLAASYRDSRVRVGELISARPESATVAVAACPGWTVHGVLSHLVAVAEDAVAGRLSGPPTDEQAAAQVAARTGVTTEQLIADWEVAGSQLEKDLAVTPVWPALMDVLAHEHDIRQAIAEPGARDIPEIPVCASRLLRGLTVPVDLAVHVDGRTFRNAPSDEGPVLELETTWFEAFRFRLGRRSRTQLAAMRWTGDPAPVLDHLVIFGPSPVDIVE